MGDCNKWGEPTGQDEFCYMMNNGKKVNGPSQKEPDLPEIVVQYNQ